MVTTDLGACEWFVWDLRRSNLIDRGQLDQVVGEFLSKHPGAEPPALAEFLVDQGILTQFQCERLLQGKTQGFVLGPFTLMDALGTGSMGTVYKAQSKTDNAWYAVKVLPRRSMWNVRIARRKVRVFEQVKHPSVVPFVDVGTAGGMHYLAWPLIEGEPLDKFVQQQGKLKPSQVASIGVQIADGLAACRPHELFHGLLKPSNVMIASGTEVRILDFGIGCLLAETEGESLVDTMSTANSVSNGLDCASPESIMDPTNLNPTGDQYSLGCVLYYCATGRYPFPEGTAVEKMMAHQTKKPTPISELNPDIPEALIAVIDRLMQKTPEARYPNAEAIVTALKPLAGSESLPKQRRRPAQVTLNSIDVHGVGESMPNKPVPELAVQSERRSPPPVQNETPRPVPRVTQPAIPQRIAPPIMPAPVLPARATVTHSPPSPTATPPQKQVTAPTPTKLPVVKQTPKSPVREPEQHQPTKSNKPKLGTVGIILATLLVVGVVWLVAKFLF